MQKSTPIILKMIGIVLFMIGMLAAFYGPYEIFVFYLFSEGGRFHYDGFGVGSLWFAAQVVQIIGYYCIAAVFLPAGYGHLKLRRWGLTLTRLFIWFWLGAGILLVGNGIALLPALTRFLTAQEKPSLQLPAMAVFLFVVLILLPLLALWFYRSKRVTAAFETHDPNRTWIDKIPSPLLAEMLLFVIMIIVLHITTFLQGLFPLFGQILFLRPSARIIALSVLILGVIIYGTAKLKRWAWWGALGFMSLLSISSAMTFLRHDFYDLIRMMNLPASEMGYIDRMTPLHNYHLAGLVVTPLLVALGLLIYSRRYFLNNGDRRQEKAHRPA
jgi:hypothetical protein